MYFLFDTSVLIDYIRSENSTSAHAILKAREIGECYISIVSIMELYNPNRPKKDVEEAQKIYEMYRVLNINIVYITQKAQRRAVNIVKNHYSNLGQNRVPDALIISMGIEKNAYIVTKDYIWSRIYSQVLSPEDVIRQF